MVFLRYRIPILALLVLAILQIACGSAAGLGNLAVETQEARPAAAGPADRPAISIFGLEENRLEAALVESHLPSLSPQWVRRNGLLWSAVEPVEGQRNWDRVAALEEELARKSAAGVETILIVRSTPTWAQAAPDTFCGPIKPESLAAFGQFMADAVDRYSAPPFNVRYWELWNEPDVATGIVGLQSVFGCWGDPGDPFYGGGRYGEMLKAAYPAIKSADPDAYVLHGGLLLDCDPLQPPADPANPGAKRDCTSSLFLQGVLEAGGGCCFDGVSFHAYDYYFGQRGEFGNLNWNSTSNTTGPVVHRKAAYLNAVLSGYGVGDKELFNTESALLCGATGDEAECQTGDFDATKTIYLVQSYAAAFRHGLIANVWFSLGGWRASGLLDAGLAPNAAYRAYQFAARTLAEARFVDDISAFPGVTGAGYQANGTDIWVVWSVDQESHFIELPLVPTRMTDAEGVSQPPAGTIEVSNSPVYLFWDTLN